MRALSLKCGCDATHHRTGAVTIRVCQAHVMDHTERLAGIGQGSGHLYGLDFMGREWLGRYVADVDAVASWLRAALEGK